MNPTKRIVAALLVICSLLFLPGCAGLDPGFAAFVRAERMTKANMGQEWIEYVRADTTKSTLQKADRETMLRLWEKDLQAAEARIGGR